MADRLHQVSQAMREAEGEAGRLPHSTQLLAVSKQQPVAAIRKLAQQGVRDFGENHLQPALEKMEQLSDLDLVWHFIGPIQSRKAQDIACRFDWVHSLCRQDIAERLHQSRPGSLPPLPVCVQIQIGEEPSKSGLPPQQLLSFLEGLKPLDRLQVRGLMTIPPVQTEYAQQRTQFAGLRRCLEQAQAEGYDLDTLSMGMSMDLKAAIMEGATWVRIGTALFGPRPVKVAHA